MRRYEPLSVEQKFQTVKGSNHPNSILCETLHFYDELLSCIQVHSILPKVRTPRVATQTKRSQINTPMFSRGLTPRKRNTPRPQQNSYLRQFIMQNKKSYK